MYRIVLQTLFHEYQNNHKIHTSFDRPGLRPLGANKNGLIIFILISAESCYYITLQNVHLLEKQCSVVIVRIKLLK